MPNAYYVRTNTPWLLYVTRTRLHPDIATRDGWHRVQRDTAKVHVGGKYVFDHICAAGREGVVSVDLSTGSLNLVWHEYDDYMDGITDESCCDV